MTRPRFVASPEPAALIPRVACLNYVLLIGGKERLLSDRWSSGHRQHKYTKWWCACCRWAVRSSLVFARFNSLVILCNHGATLVSFHDLRDSRWKQSRIEGNNSWLTRGGLRWVFSLYSISANYFNASVRPFPLIKLLICIFDPWPDRHFRCPIHQ